MLLVWGFGLDWTNESGNPQIVSAWVVTAAQTCFVGGVCVCVPHLEVSGCQCVSLWRWFLSRLWLLCARPIPHGVEQSYHVVMALLTGVCSFFCFPFIFVYVCLALPKEKDTCSVAFQSTQTVCLYKSSKFNLSKLTNAFVCILCFCVHSAVEHENCTAFEFQ